MHASATAHACVPALARVQGVEIFASGTWNGYTFTEADLDRIAVNFERLRNADPPILRPPVVLGHDEDQSWLRQTGLPAAGWVERCWREQTRLYADFAEVPPAVARLINQRAYRQVSVELYQDFVHAGEHYGWTLRRVALLGGELPAVHGLADLPLATFSEPESPCVAIIRPAGVPGEHDLHARRQRILAFCERLLVQGKLLPAMLEDGRLVELALLLDNSQVHRFGEQTMTALDAFLAWLESFPVLVQFAERLAPANGAAEDPCREVEAYYDQHAAELRQLGFSRERFVQVYRQSGMTVAQFLGRQR